MIGQQQSQTDTVLAETPYNEFYGHNFEPREHYRPLWEHIRQVGQSLKPTEPRRHSDDGTGRRACQESPVVAPTAPSRLHRNAKRP